MGCLTRLNINRNNQPIATQGSERRSYLSSPIERPDRKIIQQKNNCPKIIKITKFIKWRKEIFSYCFLIKLSQSSSKKEREKKVHRVLPSSFHSEFFHHPSIASSSKPSIAAKGWTPRG